MPERLTPVDILNMHFSRRIRGYGIVEVDEFVRRVASDMETLLTECAQLKERASAQERELAQYHALETTMRDALIMAQRAADETRAAAQAQASAQMQESAARLAEANAQVERLHQERRRLAREFQGRLSAQMAWLSEELGEIPEPGDTAGAKLAVEVLPALKSASSEPFPDSARPIGEPKTLLPGTAPTALYATAMIASDSALSALPDANGAGPDADATVPSVS